MGMGEPMLNLDAVLEACERLPEIGITHRRTTISTVGWIPGIEKLAESDMPVRLALSLHAADEALRSELMPVNERFPLSDVIEACRAFYERRRRRIFIEYVMLGGVNDRYEQALALARVLRAGHESEPSIFKVNLIPFNPSGHRVQGLGPRVDRRLPRRPGIPRHPGDGAPDPRPGHRRGLRPAGRDRRPSPRAPRPRAASRSRSSACSSGLGSQRATSGSSSRSRRPNSFRNWVVVR